MMAEKMGHGRAAHKVEASHGHCNLLDHLEKVRSVGPARWLACCPAHPDKRPSLSIRQLDDGRLLVHCFSGCNVESVLGAIGLDMGDLFPPRDEGAHFSKGERRPFPAADILRALAFEATVLLCAANDLRNGYGLCDDDLDRLALAVGRLQEGLEVGGLA